MESVQLCLTFRRERAETEEIIALMRSLMCFQPTGFKSTRKQFKRIGSKNFWEQLRMNLMQEKRYRMSAHSYTPYQTLSIEYSAVTGVLRIWLSVEDETRPVFSEKEAVVHAFAQSHEILSAALRTGAESHWNGYVDYIDAAGNNLSLIKCRAEHPELSEIRTVRIGTSDHIDGTQFSGYSTDYDGIWFGCSYEMWFGADYDAYIPLHTLAAFTDCESNETLENGTVHIIMYDSKENFQTAESVRRARHFRAHTDCDTIAVRCREEIARSPAALAQANMVIESGSFPNGGVRRILTFLDADGKPVTRGEAAQIHVSERGTDGKAVSETIEPYSEV